MLGSDICLVDGVQCMTVRQHSLVSCMITILARFVVLGCLTVKPRCLLMTRCGTFRDVPFYFVWCSWQFPNNGFMWAMIVACELETAGILQCHVTSPQTRNQNLSQRRP